MRHLSAIFIAFVLYFVVSLFSGTQPVRKSRTCARDAFSYLLPV